MKNLFLTIGIGYLVTVLAVSCIDKSVIKQAIKEAAEEAAYDDDDDYDKGYRDSEKWGKVVTKEIILKDFSKVAVGGIIDVIYNNGDSTRVTVHGNQKVFDLYNFTSENGVFSAELKKDTRHRVPSLTMHIVTPNIEAFSLHGTGDLDIKSHVVFGDLEIELTGTGDIDITDMECLNLKVADYGTGDIKFRNVDCQGNSFFNNPGTGDIKAQINANDIDIINNGTGDVELNVNCHNLTADNNGTGEIELEGQTDVFTRQAGSLSKIDSKKLRATTINR